MASIDRVTQSVDIDEMLTIVGDYGRFQKLVNVLFCIIMFPSAFPLLITYFCVKNPDWRCSPHSTVCNNKTATYSPSNITRCSPHMKRSDWLYVTSKSYSIVTEFDLICDREYLVQLQTSILFFGFVFGALIVGWCADNFGRKRVLFTSITVVITVGFASIFVNNIFVFIGCRFVIGFFLHGTYPQLYIMISEIVGNKARAFANNMTFFSVGFAFSALALKGYLLPNWKLLFVACTAPYLFVVFFAKFVPESVRYHRVKGELDEALAVFHRIAYWNNSAIPPCTIISPAAMSTHKSTPLDLFRTRKMARISCVTCWTTFTGAMSFFCLYYAAGNISGHMYSDFLLITVLDIPASIILTPLVDNYGRKRCSMVLLFLSAASCLGLGFSPSHGHFKILRIFLGMFGKTCNVLSGMALVTWSMELYPTSVRGEAGGLRQMTNKIGATSSAWIDARLANVYPGAVFMLIGGLMLVTVLFQSLLWETNGKNIADICEPGDESLQTRDSSSLPKIGNNRDHTTANDKTLTQHIKENYLGNSANNEIKETCSIQYKENPAFEGV